MKPLSQLCERLLGAGAGSLSDIELLAMIMASDEGSGNNLDLAQAIMNQFGTLRALFNTSLQTFSQVRGSKPLHYAQLQAAQELSNRHELTQLLSQQQITHINQTYAFLKKQLRDKKNEVFAIIFLDNQNRVIAYEQLFQGSINVATIHIRPIIERIIAHNAAAIILAHNHPSGMSDASTEDFAITKKISQVICHLDTRLLDHIVIGDNEAFSIMHEQKWLC